MFGVMDVPFGFERRTEEKIKDIEKDKQYIDVDCLMKKDGMVEPLSIYWNERKYDITLLSKASGRELKENITGYRYKCKVGMKIFFLFFNLQRWYIEIN